MIYLISGSAALATGLFVYLVFWIMPVRSRAVQDRLVQLGLDGGGSAAERARRQRNRNAILDRLELLGEWFTSDGSSNRALREQLVHAGFRHSSALPIYWGIRISSAVVLGTLAAVSLAMTEISGPLVYLHAAWIAAIGWFGPRFVLSRMVHNRQKEIQKALPDALDLLVICVEAGLGLNEALIRVAKEMRHISEVLTDEIALTNLKIRAGTPRDEAFLDLAERTGVGDVHSLVTMLIQTEQFGTSVAKSLRVHAATLRTKRRQRAEEAAAKTTIKILFPLGFCIFPALFVVLLGPALIEIFRTLSSL